MNDYEEWWNKKLLVVWKWDYVKPKLIEIIYDCFKFESLFESTDTNILISLIVWLLRCPPLFPMEAKDSVGDLFGLYQDEWNFYTFWFIFKFDAFFKFFNL